MSKKLLLFVFVLVLFVGSLGVVVAVSSNRIKFYVESNYDFVNGSVKPVGFSEADCGWHYPDLSNFSGRPEVFVRKVSTQDDALMYKYDGFYFGLTPDFSVGGGSARSVVGRLVSSKEVGLDSPAGAVLYKSVFDGVDVGVSADYNHFYEIVRLDERPSSDADVYFRLDTDADVYYLEGGSYTNWEG